MQVQESPGTSSEEEAQPLEHRCLKEHGEGTDSEIRPAARNEQGVPAQSQMQLGGGNQTIQSCAILSRLTKTHW